MSQIIQVFEHDTLQIGHTYNGVRFQEEHLNAMLHFSKRNGSKYYTVLHKSVKFANYVGIIQVGQLRIEILPKADKNPGSDTKLWQGILLDMLASCKLIKIETLEHAGLRLKPHAILDLYFEQFLLAVEQLLAEGLIRQYYRYRGQSRSLKGQILFKEQLKHNLIHQERVYTAYNTYNYSHDLNQILWTALAILKRMPLSIPIETKLNRLLRQFPSLKILKAEQINFGSIKYNLKTYRYKPAIEIAQLIIGNFSPDIRSGQHHLLALLFDMNQLFEEYVYRQLLKHRTEGLQIRRQVQQAFWQKRKIQPDLVIRSAGQQFVLDTKWKVLEKAQPSIGDLKQMYVYGQFFNAQRSFLLYPAVHPTEAIPEIPYAPDASGRLSYCSTVFLPILKDGKLNKELGQYILSLLGVG